MVSSFKSDVQNETEQQIMSAGRKVFMRKGMNGARMQEIADEAQINKAMLHYYFRTKEKLFMAIFRDAFNNFFPQIQEILTSDPSAKDKIGVFIDRYLDLLVENPYLPGFILNEINRDPGAFISVFLDSWFRPQVLIEQMEREMNEGKIRKMDPVHLMVNVVAMCAFPFIGRPFITAILLGGERDRFEQFISERKNEIMKFLLPAIHPEEKL